MASLGQDELAGFGDPQRIVFVIQGNRRLIATVSQMQRVIERVLSDRRVAWARRLALVFGII